MVRKAEKTVTPPTPDGIEVRRRKLVEYQHDPGNANKGSDRGRDILRESLADRGSGSSLVADGQDRLIGGNQTIDVARELGYEDAIEVTVPPHTLLVARRADLDLTSEDDHRARQLSLDLNRAGDFREWAAAELKAAEQELGDVSTWFDGDEFEMLMLEAEAEALAAGALDGGQGGSGISTGMTADRQKQIKVVIYAHELSTFERALRVTGRDVRSEAVIEVCRFYLEHHQEPETEMDA